MSSTAPDANSLTLHGLPFVSVPSVGTGDLSFLSIPSNYTAVMNNELWLVNEDPNTGVLTRVCQISLPPGYKITQDQAPAPYDPEGTDMIPSDLLGVHGLRNKHIKKQPKLAGMPAYKVQRWVLEQSVDLAYSVKVEQERIERLAHLAARETKEADELAAAVAMVNAAISDGQVRVVVGDDGTIIVENGAREGSTR